jgi:type IV secretory pathway VirB6-like protein
MIFVSPIIIPLCLFKRTANIFQEWLKSLISFCLQPMILFLYVAFFIMVIDKTMIGSASFSGAPPAKTISCKKICKNSDGTAVPNKANGDAPACDQAGQREIDPLNDSVACMINFNSYGKFHAFDFLGITLPNLVGFFSDTGTIKTKVLTILRAALLMFLLTQFIDEIPGIASALIGGSALPQSKSNGVGDLIKAMGVVANIQKRLARGLKKHATSTAKSAGSKAKSAIRSSGSKGKSVEDAGSGDKDGSDEAQNSDSGGGDSGDSGGGGGGGDEGK